MAYIRKDGRIATEVRIKNPITGETKRVSVYGKTRKQLEAERQRVLNDAQKYIIALTSEAFDKWYKRCLDDKLREKQINQVTYDSYLRIIKRLILPRLPRNIKLANITPAHVKYMLRGIPQDRTRQYAYSIMSSIMKEAVFEGLIEHNPCSRVRKPHSEATPADVITPEQYRALLAAVADTELYYVFLLAFDTGARRGELCALKWSSIEDGCITINSSLKRTSNGLIDGTTKTKYSVRTIPVSSGTLEALRSWKNKLRILLMKQGEPWDENGYIFRSTSNYAKPMPPDYVTRAMTRLKNKLRLPSRVCIHSFRHTHATLMAAEDVNPKKIQTRLGHADAAFTMNRYTHRDGMDKGMLKVIEAIEKRYKPVSPSV